MDGYYCFQSQMYYELEKKLYRWINLHLFECLNWLKVLFLYMDRCIISWELVNIFWLSLLVFSHLGIYKSTKVLCFSERRKRSLSTPSLSLNSSHSPKEDLMIFNSENVTIHQSKIDLLKLTDYPILCHKRMHPHARQAFLQETWGCKCLHRMLSI